jgi:hypothetical protein
MTLTKLFPSGAWEVSAMVNGCRRARVYYFYTKAQARRAFIVDLLADLA